MVAVPRRGERLRKLARMLSGQYGLPHDKPIEAVNNYTHDMRWQLVWRDGPTETQVRRAAAKLDKEALDGVGFRREYSDTAYAVAAIRHLREGDPVDDEFQADVSVYDARRLLDATKNPGPRDDRERHMAARLVDASVHRSSVFGDGDAICREATEKGLAPLLRGEGAPPLSPIEVLSDRYAHGRASAMWRCRLVPMTALEAFAAVQADETAPPEHVAAALSLLPELHAALDAAGASLQARFSPAQ